MVRDETQKLYGELGEENFRRELAKLDEVSAARIARNDRQRLIRAYEVARHTGTPLSAWQKKNPGDAGEAIERHLLMPPREELYAACDARFANMVRGGALEEARAFLARGLDPELPAMKTLGLRELGAHLRGETSLDEAIAKAQQATRHYAKRQMTWFRNQWKEMA
jgi:tRNA dimethylallyltransferase